MADGSTRIAIPDNGRAPALDADSAIDRPGIEAHIGVVARAAEVLVIVMGGDECLDTGLYTVTVVTIGIAG
jgi:hypothetical protein